MNNSLRKAIKQILLTGSTAVFAAGALAAVTPGQQNPPPGPGQVPDYFGIVPNYANSPQPVMAVVSGGSGTGAAATTYDYSIDVQTRNIMDVQGGVGYKKGDSLTLTGGLVGSVATTCNVIVNNVDGTGAIIPNADGTLGIDLPTTAGATCAGFTNPISNTGIRKFVDSLPLLNTPNNLGQKMPIAVADTTTFPAVGTTPAADYYEIAEVEYTQKLHTDLPASHLRGYVQIKTGGFTVAGFNAATDKLAYASQYAGYLGPVIVATKDKPVRIKLTNLLSTGKAGEIPMPVDTTYMGADSAEATQNRTALHLHGGNTPWISDGTPRQWVKPAGELIGPNKGETTRDVPDMWFDAAGNVVPAVTVPADPIAAGLSNNPGNGSMTFYYTNQQSARLMFYHDHAEGITRLNVYGGMAAVYVLQDQTEQSLVAAGTIPGLADTIPLVIQEKTFVPNNTQPVMNFYAAFASQLESQDPTWRWGSTPLDANGKIVSAGPNGNGDLWVPHVFMPNQNPGDISGGNAVGRWDYGPWFWPPFTAISNGPITNPYYDPACLTTTQYCEPSMIPGVPNGSTVGVVDAKTGVATSSPSGTPEAFNDTPLVNGTVYPYINVDPKQYRLRILSVGNDRMLNLSLVVAASKNSATTADANAGRTSSAPAKLCNGATAESLNPAECTEVKMVPFTSAQNETSNTPFPEWWYSPQKDGVTFDGRPSGVFDPKTRGPAMVQIGTEGGFLSSPVVIKNQPVNYEYNPKNILIGNIKEHALLLGPAERADVLVDFSNFAGSTLIMYNDAGAPVPAWDLRLDYYTGNFDNTDTGGAFSTIPGYGPNSRTIMQIRVSGTNGSHPVDDLGTINMTNLTPAIQTAFRKSQEPIIVPQAAYNPVYGLNVPDSLGTDLSRIADFQLTFKPIADANPTVGPATLEATAVTMDMSPKTIIEDWTMNWGRMNALLGTEVPRTNATIQTSIPQAFIDPPTELVKITSNTNAVPITGTLADGTQLWKITHNGVDSHSIHFHLFHVQLVNRVGWDGAVYPPELNELGWKDSLLMHPLSDVVVALRPMTMDLPFKVANSHRKLDPSMSAKGFDYFNLNPITGNSSNVSDVSNADVNYGWEYLWHCHILGHEENDMMRTIAVAQPPEAASILAATTVAKGVKLDWKDNSMTSNWVEITRSLDGKMNGNGSAFQTVDATFDVPVASLKDQAGLVFGKKECDAQTGCLVSYTDTTADVGTSYYYRVVANNTVGGGAGRADAPLAAVAGGGFTYGDTLPVGVQSLLPTVAGVPGGYEGYANVTASSDAVSASRITIPTATVTAGPLEFGNVASVKTITVQSTGTGNLKIANALLTTGTNFAISSNTCPASLAPGLSCAINVTFKPTKISVPLTDTLTITDNSSTGPTQSVVLNGTVTAPIATVTESLAFGDALVNSTSAVKAVTVSNSGTRSLLITGIAPPAQFVIAPVAAAVNCSTATPLAAGSSCVIGVTYKPTAAGASPAGNLTITDNAYTATGVANPTQTVALSGNGVLAALPTLTASLLPTPPATVRLNWTASSSVVAQADSYQVQRTAAFTNVAAACPAFANLGAATAALSATDTTIVANRTYCYRVVAKNGAGTFTSTPGVKVTTPAPAIPTKLTITGISSTDLTVGWTASGGAVVPTGYEVQQCVGLATTGTCAAAGNGWISLGTTATTSYAVTGLSTGTPYLYRVRAYNPLTSGFLTSTVIANPVAAADSPAALIANTSASQSVKAGNLLTNDLPALAVGRTVTNLSAVTHTGGTTGSNGAATATVNCTTAGACTVVLGSPVTNTTTLQRQASKRGTYTFTYTERYATNYGNFTSNTATVTVTVN